MTQSVQSNTKSTAVARGTSHSVLVLVSLALTVLVALALGWYALRIGSLLLLAHAGELAFVSVGAWATFDAGQIRKLLREASLIDDSGTIDEKRRKRFRRQADEAQTLHLISLSVPTAAIAFFVCFQMWRLGMTSTQGISAGFQATLGLLAIATSIVWLVISKTLAVIHDDEIPEAVALARGFRELQWSAWLVAGSLFLGTVIPTFMIWAGRGLGVWLISACIEQLARTMWAWIALPSPADESSRTEVNDYVSPINLLLREAFLVRANPLASLFDVLEKRFGVNFRASWAIAFVRRITGPLLVVLILFGWLVTAFQVVEPHQFAVEERLGITSREPLAPGLHITWPWPFGQVRRYPVKTVSSMQIGFKDTSQSDKTSRGFDPDAARALLWTQSHEEEFALVLGNGAEVVAVNAIVYHKIHEDRERFFDYVYHSQNPETALEAFAYRTLLELTRSATLNDVLTADRAGFARRFRDTLREYAERERLGIDVAEVSIINLHPPVDAAADYLDVISAKIDAMRMKLEATGFRSARLLTADAESLGLIASAKIDAARRISGADAESSEFLAADSSWRLAPESYLVRMWIEGLENSLGNKRLFLVEKSLLETSDQAWFDLRPMSVSSPPEGSPNAK